MSRRGSARSQRVDTANASRESEVPSGHHARGLLPGAEASGAERESRPPASEGSIPTHEQVASLAYELWEAHGRPMGTDRADWFEAERLLSAKAR